MFQRLQAFLRGLQGKRERPLIVGDWVKVKAVGSCWFGHVGRVAAIALRKDEQDHPIYMVKLHGLRFPQQFRDWEVSYLEPLAPAQVDPEPGG